MSTGEKVSLAKRIADITPTLAIDVSVDTYSGIDGESDNDYLKERHARYKKSVELLESDLKDFDEKEIAARVRRSMESELAIKRAELLKVEAEMDSAGVSYSGKSEKSEK